MVEAAPRSTVRARALARALLWNRDEGSLICGGRHASNQLIGESPFRSPFGTLGHSLTLVDREERGKLWFALRVGFQ